MQHLTPDQQTLVQNTVTDIIPRLQPNCKQHFIRTLKSTIGADYTETAAATEEYLIAIWRGVVELLCHSTYTYTCTACAASTYKTVRGTLKAFDRRYPSCPNCNAVEIYDPGDSGLKAGTFIHKADLPNYIEAAISIKYAVYNCKGVLIPNQYRVGAPPKARSPLLAIVGHRKYTDAHASTILSDTDQLNKFFTQFINSHLRQIINENGIQYRSSETHQEVGCADHMAVLEICALLKKYRVRNDYNPKDTPVTDPSGHDTTTRRQSYHIIYCRPLATPPEFTVAYTRLHQKYLALGCEFQYTTTYIRIPNLPAPPLIKVTISNPTIPVLIASTQDPGAAATDSDTGPTNRLEHSLADRTQHIYRTSLCGKGSPMSEIERNEVFATIRASLPDGPAKQTFDIYTEGIYAPPAEPNIWTTFSNQFGDKVQGYKVRTSTIANFLSKVLGVTVNPRHVDHFRNQIKTHMIIHGIGTENPTECE